MTKKAREITADYTGPLKAPVDELAENVVAMASRLRRARTEMAKEPLVIDYDNGGGQRGTRKNPFVDQYLAMVKQYNASLRTLSDLLGCEVKPDREVNRFAEFIRGA